MICQNIMLSTVNWTTVLGITNPKPELSAVVCTTEETQSVDRYQTVTRVEELGIRTRG
jgi:hypothetical protein